MKLSLINEMALSNIWIDKNLKPRNKNRDESGFTDQFHGFDEKSLKGYTSIKFLDELSNKLSRLNNLDINLFITDKYPKSINELAQSSGIPLAHMQTSINFCLGGEGGLLRVSPWLILHQLGEAIITYEDRGDEFNELYTFADYNFPSTWYVDIFKFGSAREAKENNKNKVDDMSQELITEYLWHGRRIRRNYPKWSNKKQINEFVGKIEDKINKLLHEYIGKILKAGFV